MCCLLLLNGAWIYADIWRVLLQMSVSKTDLRTSLFTFFLWIQDLWYLRQLQIALNAVENSVHLSGFHPLRFCRELRSKPSSLTHVKMLCVCWFLGRAHLGLRFQKARKTEQEGGRGGESLISFGMAVQSWLLSTSSYFTFLLSKPLLAVAPQAGWVRGCVSHLSWRVAQGVTSCLGILWCVAVC